MKVSIIAKRKRKHEIDKDMVQKLIADFLLDKTVDEEGSEETLCTRKEFLEAFCLPSGGRLLWLM